MAEESKGIVKFLCDEILAIVNKLKSDISTKQDTLVSGTNIKTVNDQSLLGTGNVTIDVPNIAQDLATPSANAVPSTQAVADESSRITSIMNSYVKKSGDTITGNLNSTAEFHEQLLGYGQREFRFINKDAQRLASLLYYEDDTYKTVRNRLYITPEGTDFKELELSYNKINNVIYTMAPHCTNDGSIVTMKSHSGQCIQFGNGLKLQWGIVQVTNGVGIITFSVPFNSTYYSIISICTAGSGTITNGVPNTCASHSFTTTGCKIQSNENYAYCYFVIGY